MAPSAIDGNHDVMRPSSREPGGAPLGGGARGGRGFRGPGGRPPAAPAGRGGRGWAPPTRLGELLAAGGRYRGVRAPGWGLTLAGVAYPGGPLGG